MKLNEINVAGAMQLQATYNKNSNRVNYSKKPTKSKEFDRNLLPKPEIYYKEYFPNLKVKAGWISVRCPFHNERNPSLSINLVSGGFKCHACNARGGDILDFQRLYHHQTFHQAVTSLGAWRLNDE